MVLFLGLMTYVIVESVRLGRVVRYARQQRSHTPTGAN